MPRLYREAPLNSIWEGSGNVMGLDVLRAIGREREAIPAVMTELEKARGNHPNLDRAIDELRAELAEPEGLEGRMRMVTEMMALTLQGALLTQLGDSAVAEAFCASRLAQRYRGAFGTLPRVLVPLERFRIVIPPPTCLLLLHTGLVVRTIAGGVVCILHRPGGCCLDSSL